MSTKKSEKLVVLFGSRAKGSAGKRSDVDVAVLDDHELSLQEMVRLDEELAKKLSVSEDDIDIVDLQRASPLLQYEVAQHGKLLQGKQEDFFTFRLLARKRYLHAEKLYRIREQYLARVL